MSRPEDSSEVASPSYLSSILSLIVYGSNSTFGRIYRGIIGIFSSSSKSKNFGEGGDLLSLMFSKYSRDNQEGRI